MSPSRHAPSTAARTATTATSCFSGRVRWAQHPVLLLEKFTCGKSSAVSPSAPRGENLTGASAILPLTNPAAPSSPQTGSGRVPAWEKPQLPSRKPPGRAAQWQERERGERGHGHRITCRPVPPHGHGQPGGPGAGWNGILPLCPTTSPGSTADVTVWGIVGTKTLILGLETLLWAEVESAVPGAQFRP